LRDARGVLHDVFGDDHFLHLAVDALVALEGAGVVAFHAFGLFIESLDVFLHLFYGGGVVLEDLCAGELDLGF
jgi:hypothetical protein